MSVFPETKGRIQRCVYCGKPKAPYQPTCGCAGCIARDRAEQRRRQRDEARRRR